MIEQTNAQCFISTNLHFSTLNLNFLPNWYLPLGEFNRKKTLKNPKLQDLVDLDLDEVE